MPKNFIGVYVLITVTIINKINHRKLRNVSQKKCGKHFAKVLSN